MKIRWLLLFIAALYVPQNGKGQELISFEEQLFFTKEIIQQNLGFPAYYDVQLFKIIYTTKHVFMEPDTASGIIAVPLDSGYQFPILIYDHGTVASRKNVPSMGSYESLFAVAIAGQGYNCVAPDYIGLGISEGLHPYLHSESEARAGIDLAHAVLNLSDYFPFHFNEKLFVTGYSQGGHAAMATAMVLKETEEFDLVAAAPLSGPYSISDIMIDQTLGEQEYNFPAYLASVFLTANLAYPDLMEGLDIEDIFKAEFVSPIRSFEKEEIDLYNLNGQMIMLLAENGNKVLPRNMLQEEVINALEQDPDFALNRVLREMDVCNWIPDIPLKMFYCGADEQVSFRNAVYTDSLMNAGGALAVSAENVDPAGDHSSCVLPAFLGMIQFFSAYQEIIPVNTQTEKIENLFEYWPNPADQILHVRKNGTGEELYLLSIFDLNGNLIRELQSMGGYCHIDISSIQAGIYVLRMISEGGEISTGRFIISR